jgi:hypothetical protein
MEPEDIFFEVRDKRLWLKPGVCFAIPIIFG